MNSDNIFYIDNVNVIQSNSDLVVTEIVTFKRNGELVGKLDAEIDFSDLSPELHEHAVRLLSRMPVCLYLPSEDIANVVPDSSNDKPEDIASVWQKIKKYFRGR